eukprot:TRINITY_DN16078_c0_g1_i1.p1 TRINITY_DN16078_c0_g1~~TRINITY_DN16078_c0_g1_i1.p1  ORF type:complete len:599 (+),score=133.02 TRINITY_DN16078_c0_g1_i1:154-1950(+)
MGPQAPVTTKVIERISQPGGDGLLQFRMAVAAMTGWRSDMEDTHAVLSSHGASLFSVFDGHGGSACSEFLRERLPSEMCRKMQDHEIRDIALRIDSEYLKDCPTSAQFTGSTGTLFIATPRDGEDADTPVSPLPSSNSIPAAITPPPQSLPNHLPTVAPSIPPRASSWGRTAGPGADHASFPTSLSSSEGGDKAPTSSNSSSSAAHNTPSHTSALLDGARRQFDLTVVNIGDSRVLLGHVDKANGHLLRTEALTKDHRPSDDEERERILAAQGSVYNNRVNGDLALSRAFGNGRFKKGGVSPTRHQVIAVPDVTRAVCHSGDVLVVCCDGAFENGVFTDDSLLEYVHAQICLHNDLSQAAAAVCDAAVERGSRDNVTCMVVVLGESDSFSEYRKVVSPGPVSHPASQRFMNTYEAAAVAGGMTAAECAEHRLCHLERLASLGTDGSESDELEQWRQRMPQDVLRLQHGDRKRVEWLEQWLAEQISDTASTSSDDDALGINSYNGLSYPRIQMTTEEQLNLGVQRPQGKTKSWCEILEVIEAEVSPDTESLDPSSPNGRFQVATPHTPPPAFYVNNSFSFNPDSDSDSDDGLNVCVKPL